MEFVSWNDYPIYELEKKIHVPNHQLRLTMSGDVLEIPLFFGKSYGRIQWDPCFCL